MDRGTRRDLSLSQPKEDNYMLNAKVLQSMISILGWVPIVDICCDTLGSNALAPLYLDARVDALIHEEYLRGKRVVCNPPFDQAEEFIELLEQAYSNNKDTRAMLIVP